MDLHDRLAAAQSELGGYDSGYQAALAACEQRIVIAVNAMRERCAKIADDFAKCAEDIGEPDFGRAIAEKIRSGS